MMYMDVGVKGARFKFLPHRSLANHSPVFPLLKIVPISQVVGRAKRMSANSLEQCLLLGECSMGGGFYCGLNDSHNSYLHEKAKTNFQLLKLLF